MMQNYSKKTPVVTSKSFYLAMFLCIMLIVTSCGSGTSSDDATRTTNTGDIVVVNNEKPQYGGKLVYGIEADPKNLNPVNAKWAISETMIGMAVYDPLVAYDSEGKPQPYLAESFVANSDATEWTFTLRPGVLFHDGTSLTADVVKAVYDKHLASPLTGLTLTSLDHVEVTDPLHVVFYMKRPWFSFPTLLTSQLGVIPALSVINSPDGGIKPVGTGPFMQSELVSGKHWLGKKNPNYWRQGLPYLDEVEFRPFPETTTRMKSLEGVNPIDIVHTATAQDIKDYTAKGEQKKFQVFTDRGEGEEFFAQINVLAAPFDDIRARQALAYATDVETFNATIQQNVTEIAQGPFKPDSKWYTKTDYPQFDLEKAKQLVEEVKKNNNGRFSFTLKATAGSTEPDTQLLKNMWAAAGMDVTIDLVTQNTLISDAVAGNYQVNLWRQFGAPDPDMDTIWWTSENVRDDLSINFAHNADEQIDEALQNARDTDDFATRKAAFDVVQQRFTDLLPYIWLFHEDWTIVAQNHVHNVTNGVLPNGQPGLPLGGFGDFGGTNFVTQIWVSK